MFTKAEIAFLETSEPGSALQMEVMKDIHRKMIACMKVEASKPTTRPATVRAELQYCNNTRKIECIKIIHGICGGHAGLKEAKNLVELWYAGERTPKFNIPKESAFLWNQVKDKYNNLIAVDILDSLF